MKKITNVLLGALSLVAVGVSAQSCPSPQDLMMYNEWKPVSSTDKGELVVSFSDKEQRIDTSINGETSRVASLYYLSGKKEQTFDKSKVGRFSQGTVIVFEGERGAKNYDIIEISDKQLILKSETGDTLEYESIE